MRAAKLTINSPEISGASSFQLAYKRCTNSLFCSFLTFPPRQNQETERSQKMKTKSEKNTQLQERSSPFLTVNKRQE